MLPPRPEGRGLRKPKTMTQSRKPAGSPGGTGGQFDTDTTGGTGDLPALGRLPDDGLPEVKTIISDPNDDSVPGLEGKTRGYLRWEGDRACVWVTTDYHDLQDFVRPVLDKRLAAQAADETTRWTDAHPLPQGVHETMPPHPVRRSPRGDDIPLHVYRPCAVVPVLRTPPGAPSARQERRLAQP